MKKTLSVFQWLMLIVNIFFVISLLISYTAIYMDPEQWWAPAFFGLAYPVLVVVNLLFTVYWLLSFRLSVLFSLLTLLIGWNMHRNVFTFNSREHVKPNDSSAFKIMTYNAHLFKSIKTNEYNKEVKEEMLQMIENETPTIICFQEFYSRKKGAYNIKDSLKKSLGLEHVYLEKFEENDMGEILGMAIFSKYPILRRKEVPFGDTKSLNSCIYADILFNNDTIRVINIHLQSINFQPEDYSYLNKVTRQAETDVQSSRRIGGRLKRAFINRSSQAKIVARLIESSPYPVIVSGDFNDTPISFAYHTLLESGNLKSTFTEKGSGFGITYGGDFPNLQIDHILCSQHVDVLSYHVVKKKFSDHYPVVAELRFPSTGK